MRAFRMISTLLAILAIGVSLNRGVAAEGSSPSPDPDLIRKAEIIVTSNDPVARQLAMLEVTNPELPPDSPATSRIPRCVARPSCC